MLQTMRQSTQSTAAKVIIGLIVLSFAAFGLETLLPSGAGTSVAEVNGEEITPFALQEAITQQKRQLISILGEDIDPALLDDERLRPRALDSLVQRALLLQKTAALQLVASGAQVSQSITSIEAFQFNGEFSPDAYKSVLANAGYTLERFRRAQADDIVLAQLQAAISESEFVTAIELSATANVMAEERDVRFLVVPDNTLLDDSALSDDALRAFYTDNESLFFTQERLIVDYIELNPDDFDVVVDDAVVREQYEAVKDEYQVSQQTRVSHILLMQNEEETDQDFANRLLTVTNQLNDGVDFADVAAALSDDLGSAAMGGELGFTDGTTFPDAMEEAIAKLVLPGDISAPVETDAGTHIIRLEERIDGTSVSYETVKAELRASIEAAEAERALLIAVEELRDAAFNAADLSGPADALGVTVLRSDAFTVEAGQGVFSDARLRAAAFAEDVKVDGNNSDVLELAERRFVVVRVHEVRPPQTAPFREVETEVIELLRSELQTAALSEIRTAAQDALEGGETLEQVAQTLGLDWRVELAATRLVSQLPRPVLDAAFSMTAGKTNQLRTVSIPGEGHAVVQLARVAPGSVNALSFGERDQLTSRRATEQQQVSFSEFMLFQRNESDIVLR
jgi:peptidyl-prolyl cis-trans isomerase D